MDATHEQKAVFQGGEHCMENSRKFCSNCGEKIAHDTKFCAQCGVPTVSNPSSGSNEPESDAVKKHENVTVFIVLGWIFCGISLLFIPILFAAGGVVFGYLLRTKNKRTHGTIMMIASVACGLLGALLGMAAAGY